MNAAHAAACAPMAEQLLHGLVSALRQGAALTYQEYRGFIVRAADGRELAHGALLDVASALAPVLLEDSNKRRKTVVVRLSRALLREWEAVRYRGESLTAFLNAGMAEEIAARIEEARG